LRAACAGDPVRVSVCHCLDCRKRSGSAFAAQVRFPASAVTIEGEERDFVRIGDSGNRATFRFCPGCGSTIAYSVDTEPENIAIPLGLFDEGAFPLPAYSVYEGRKFPWVAIAGPGIDHYD
jgi:hypothetical protein